jgi:Flp pilus assembly protein TadG
MAAPEMISYRQWYASRHLYRRCLHDKRGATAALFAVLLVPLVGFAGLGVDLGIFYTLKRQMQSAVDDGALSGAMELSAGKGAAGGPATTDIQNLALYGTGNNLPGDWPTALTVSTGCTDPGPNQVCVNNPPILGVNTNDKFVEVILGETGGPIFSSFVGYTGTTIRVRAVAGLVSSPTCMIALNTSGQDLRNSGNVSLTLNQCAFASNSTSNDSIRFNGGVVMSAAAIATAGSTVINGNSNSISPPITTHNAPVADPYAGLITYTLPATSIGCSSGGATLQPGRYGGSCARGSTPPINLSSGTTILCPGIYYLDGEDNQGEAFVISGNGTIVQMGTAANGCTGTSTGVTIIATCSGSSCGGGFVIGGTGSNTPTVTLSAPTTGSPSDILFYQDPAHADTNKGTTTLAGGPAVHLDGVVYTPASQILLQGNPNFSGCTELIAASFTIGGTPSMTRPTGCGVRTTGVSAVVLAE